MKIYPIEKYDFIVIPEKRKVIALTTYAGKVVRGVAKCNPTDTWNEEIGKELAAHRCNIKVAEKREKRATQKLAEAAAVYADAMVEYNRALSYASDATTNKYDAEDALLVFYKDRVAD